MWQFIIVELYHNLTWKNKIKSSKKIVKLLFNMTRVTFFFGKKDLKKGRRKCKI